MFWGEMRPREVQRAQEVNLEKERAQKAVVCELEERKRFFPNGNIWTGELKFVLLVSVIRY